MIVRSGVIAYHTFNRWFGIDVDFWSSHANLSINDFQRALRFYSNALETHPASYVQRYDPFSLRCLVR